MLKEVFKELKYHKENFLNSSSGEEFENRIKSSLKRNRFNEIYQDQLDSKIYAQLKSKVIDKRATDIIPNDLVGEEFKNCYIYQPYGSQNFPDFLVFTDKHILAIEIKYSKNNNSSPMWNSNLPKANAVYIFGSYGLKDITFFLGGDILPHEERIRLLDFFDKTKKMEKEFKNEMKELFESGQIKQAKGFKVYVRRAYDQSQIINPAAEKNYFRFSDREEMEQAVLDLCDKL
jgi:hypothetical protein